MSQPLTYDDLPVPYVVSWSAETMIFPRVESKRGTGGPFLTFVDEGPYDRDGRGALWVRQSLAPGRGKPEYARFHAMRQRHAINHLRCQVCRRWTLDERDRQLFMLHSAEGRPIGEGETTSAPPLCGQCPPVAVQLCPRLRAGYVAARVEMAVPWGVTGVLYDLDTLRPLPGQVQVAYDSPDIRRVVAVKQAVQLHGITPVGPEERADWARPQAAQASGARS